MSILKSMPYFVMNTIPKQEVDMPQIQKINALHDTVLHTDALCQISGSWPLWIKTISSTNRIKVWIPLSHYRKGALRFLKVFKNVCISIKGTFSQAHMTSQSSEYNQ